MKIPFKCPICEGKCQVPGGFYNSHPGYSTINSHPGYSTISNNISENCRSCINGIIYVEQDNEYNDCITEEDLYEKGLI